MNNDVLERVLLDRAVGEMPDDTQQLLEAYLAVDMDAQRLAAETDGALDYARRALATPRERLRPLDLSKIESAARRSRARKRGAFALQLAACVAVGLVLGLTFPRESPAPEAKGVSVSAPVAGEDVAASEPGAQFWESARMSTRKKLPQARDFHPGSRRDDDRNR
jgi:anti-sigma factor RsiW